MTSRGALLAVLTVVAVAGLLLGTSGASSITATHNVDLVTTADQDAYLGFEQTTASESGTTRLDLTVTNQQSSQTTLSTVELRVNETTVDVTDGDPLSPGETATQTFQSVDCDGTVTVTAVSSEMRVEIQRAVACG